MKRENDSGFMLLEAIVAMAIFAFLTLSLLSLLNSAIFGSQILPQKTCALWVAQNQLALLMINKNISDTFIPEGEEKQCGQTWQWKIRRESTTDPRFSSLRIAVYHQNRLETIQYAFVPD
jgi:general secretion pathway protein I